MRRISRRTLLCLGGGALLLPFRPAAAHHGWGSYDADNPLEITGKVKAISYDWPHAEMHLTTAERMWEVVLAPPSRTRARGLTEEVAVPGAEATILGYPHRSREVEIRVEWVRIDGTTYTMR